MILKLINQWTERLSCVLAESLRFKLNNVYKGATLSGAILVSPSPKLHSVKTWGDARGSARGGEGWGEKAGEKFRGVKSSFTVDLPDLNYYYVY